MAENNVSAFPVATSPSQAPSVYDLRPRNTGEAMELAKLLADSDMAGDNYRGKPGNVFLALSLGASVGLDPAQSIQSIAVIGKRAGLFGDAGKGLLKQHGCIIIEDDVRVIKDKGYASCTIKRPGHPDVTRTFGLDDAKRAGLLAKDGPWKQYTERQLAWRAFWWAARDQAPDILKGLHGIEELRDIPERDVTAESTVERAEAPAANTKTSALKERLRIVNFDDVIKAFADATDAPALAAAVEKAKGLKDASQQEQANNAYHAAKERLRGASTPSEVTDNAIVTQLTAAKTTEDVQLVVDLLRPIKEADQARYTALLQRCIDRAAELEPK